MNRARSVSLALCFTLVAACSVAACGGQGGSGVVHGEGADRYPSTTARDWVTYAEAVAVVTVSDERKKAPTESELNRGEGDVEREVTLKVDEILWQAPKSQPLGSSVNYPALGWQFRDGQPDKLLKMVVDDRPRLEVGHRYVIALSWSPERCYEGDGVIPARWVGLGSGSTLPYDENLVGVGEFAGQSRTLAEAQRDALEQPADSVFALTVGKDAAALKAILAATPRGVDDGQYEPMPSDC